MDTNSQWLKHMQKIKGKRLTRGSAIKNYCKMECCVGDLDSWKNCTITNCFLWRFRTGKEILGNQTSFKKSKAKHPIFHQKTHDRELSQTNSNLVPSLLTPEPDCPSGSLVQTKNEEGER